MTKCPITHAKAYPFHIPEDSYVLGKDGWQPLHDPADTHKHTVGRHAVIASGSNASPDRLAIKFADHAHLLNDPIPVTRAQLHDFDSVYSAHFSGYGSIPATLAHAPGAMAEVFVTWLTDAQLDRMHETEAVGVNYDFAKLTDIKLLDETGGGYTQAHAYMSKRGCLSKNGEPICLAATNTAGRMWTAMTQEEVLDFARAQIAPHENTDTFIRAHIECPDTRSQRTQHLSQDALHHGWAGVTVLTD